MIVVRVSQKNVYSNHFISSIYFYQNIYPKDIFLNKSGTYIFIHKLICDRKQYGRDWYTFAWKMLFLRKCYSNCSTCYSINIIPRDCTMPMNFTSWILFFITKSLFDPISMHIQTRIFGFRPNEWRI